MNEIDSRNDIIADNVFSDTEKRLYLSGIPDGHTARIAITKNGSKPAFMMVGNGNKDKANKGTRSMDYTKELLNMTKPEGFMFGMLMDNRKITGEHTRSNETHIHNNALNGTQRGYITKAYPMLRGKDLIVRTRREHYIINPRLVISNNNWKEDERLYIEAVEKLKSKTSNSKIDLDNITPPPLDDII